LELLDSVITDGIVHELVINDFNEVREIVTFRLEKTQNRCGMGECSATIAAQNRSYALAIDDNLAIKFIAKAFPTLRIVRTQDIVVEIIQANIIDVATADVIKKEWEEKHRFKLSFLSFAEIL
jgi:hypothetical protein